MNIVLTGSLGNIGKPLTEELVQKGHLVTVISSKAERKKDIEALGAKAAIGTMQDVDFFNGNFQRCGCRVPDGPGKVSAVCLTKMWIWLPSLKRLAAITSKPWSTRV